MKTYLELSPASYSPTAATSQSIAGNRQTGLFQLHLEQAATAAKRLPLGGEPPLDRDFVKYLAQMLMTAMDRFSMQSMLANPTAVRPQTPPFGDMLSTDLFMSMRAHGVDMAPATKAAAPTGQQPVAAAKPATAAPAAKVASGTPAVQQKEPLRLSATEARKAYTPLIEQAARSHGLDPKLIESVIQAESNFNSKAVSPVGAQGLMQLMPATAAELGVTDPFNPEQNIEAGSRYLKQLMDRYHGDVKLTLAAYNWGMGNVERHPDRLPAETVKYVAKITSRMQAMA